MICAKRDQDFRIGVAHGLAVAIGQIDAAGRQADVVQNSAELRSRDYSSNDVFGAACDARGFLDARAGLRPKMKTELAGIHGGKEVLTQPGDKQQAGQAKSKQARGEQFAVIEAELQEAGIAAAKRFESALKGMMDPREHASPVILFRMLVPGGFFLHQVHHQRRHKRSREEVRSEQSEDDRFGQRHEEITRDSGQEKHRHEHDADRQRGHQRRDRDLLRAIENRLVQLLFHRHLPLDVFDGDGRVIHEDANSERKSTERHDVDRLSERAQDQQRRKNRERNRDGDDEGASPAPQEHENHQRRKNSSDPCFADHSRKRRAHEQRLIEQRLDGELRRQRRLNFGNHVVDRRHDGERRSAAGFLHREQNAPLSVLAHDILLNRVSVTHVRDILNVERGSVHHLHRNVIQRFDG